MGWIIVAWVVFLVVSIWFNKRFPWEAEAMRTRNGSCYFCGDEDCNNECLDRRKK